MNCCATPADCNDVQEAGIDVRLGELGGYIQETMESYEVEVGGKILPGLSNVLLFVYSS
jgi:hypothetical protein